MKWSRNAFSIKLWRYFVLFAAIIFVALWLLQTVLLQRFYNRMAIRNVERVAERIAEQSGDAGLETVIDGYAYSDSLLIMLTDREGNVLYSADEHSAAYEKDRDRHVEEDDEGSNPHRDNGELMSWQIGARRNRPEGYDDFLQRLLASDSGRVGYTTENGTAYVCGRVLPAPDSIDGEIVLYLSTPLGAVGATVKILRVQLVWVTIASLALGFVIAFFLARRFSRPVAAISAQAGRMAAGDFNGSFDKGFCLELDELSDTLAETSAALARLENARRELLAGVSHDLRTPLTMIKGYAEMVRQISWEDEETREKDLAIIVRETDRLTGLVGDILEYSALQSGPATELTPVNLSFIARSVVEQFAPLCKENGCTMETDFAPDVWVRGDERQLTRVLYNLLDNAIRYTDESRKVRVSLKNTDDAVRVEVRDYGKGIPQEELPYIWDRYFTARERRADAGSGLGLAIVKEILQKHDARYGVESNSGQGCLFWFELNTQKCL